MALRPIAFSIPSSTELKIVFSDSISGLVSKDNFKVESLSGNTDGLEVSGVDISDSIVIVKTRPQVAGNYYLLSMLDVDDAPFSSEKGVALIRDQVSREIFFVGIENVNPVRDRIFDSVTSFYNLENSNISNILKVHSEEIYTAQKDVGEILSDNYISIRVRDELRTRSSGASDRIINENAYEVERVSKDRTGDSLKFGKIDFHSTSENPRSYSLPDCPVSLRQTIILDEEISVDSDGNNFDGFLISLSNKNIIKLLSIKHIGKDEEYDCDNEIGTEYNVELYKYSVLNNRFDPDYSFMHSELENNQILLSEFGNISEPKIGDSLVVSYIYEDMGKDADESSVSVYNIKDITSEAVPFNSTHFFLENAPIIDSNNNIHSTGGVVFTKGENSDETPEEFSKEIKFNYSKLPGKVGEYAINYETGEVFVVGSEEVGDGTGSNDYTSVASYLYRNIFTNGLDYIVNDNELVASSVRDLAGEEVVILYKYDKTYAGGVDYNSKCHIEVLNEHVENNIGSSFSVKPQNTPVTDIFRIYNQTTGEVYNPLYSTDTEIFFSGIRSPEVKTEASEVARFGKSSLEELKVVGEFIFPSFTTTVTSSSSNNNIQLEQGIPYELIDRNSDGYFIRVKETADDEIETSDLQIRFFGDPDSNGLISSVAISSTSTPPDAGDKITIGPRGFVYNLENYKILNKTLDGTGSHINTSVYFDNTDVFIREKFFSTLSTNPGFNETGSGGLASVVAADKGEDFYQNLSRVRKIGDYCIDYKHGIVYVAVGVDQDYGVGDITYNYGKIDTKYKNIITANQGYKSVSPSDEIELSSIIYENLSNNEKEIEVLDLEDTLYIFDDETKSLDSNGEEQYICRILEDYTAILPHNISSINGIYSKKDIEGFDFLSKLKASRHEDLSSEDLNTAYSNGGGNLYDPTIVSFENNTIDFKNSTSRRFLESGDNLVLSILDASVEKFLDLRLSYSDEILFDEDLNVPKVTNINIVSVEESDGDYIISVKSGIDLSSIDSSGDILLDADGNAFDILSADSLLSTITVKSPSTNRSSITEPVLNSSDEASVIVKASVSVSDSGIDIVIPKDSILNAGDLVEVRYLNDLVPEYGTALAIDFRYGLIYVDYAYVYDDIYISYEYGDNQIDWGISDAISEGEQYYVTYKYGALRSALRNNFGDLTGIPYFKTFSIDTDREVYRRAISGTLQSFPKGPTIPSFSELIESFTDIKPKINESVFGSWILGRDYCHPNYVEYGGNLVFEKGKFEQGLSVNSDNFISIPSISNINLNEGTISTWIRPEWSGISNDATLIIDIDNVGDQEYIYKNGTSPFGSGGFDLFESSQNKGIVNYDDESFTINNFNAKSAIITGTSSSLESVSTSLTDVDGVYAYMDAGSSTVYGVGTAFSSDLSVGDTISFSYNPVIELEVVSIVSDTEITVDEKVGSTTTTTTTSTSEETLSGTITVYSNATTTVSGTGTSFTTDLSAGDTIKINEETRTISSIESDTSLTLSSALTVPAAAWENLNCCNTGFAVYTAHNTMTTYDGKHVTKITCNQAATSCVCELENELVIGDKVRFDLSGGFYDGAPYPSGYSLSQGPATTIDDTGGYWEADVVGPCESGTCVTGAPAGESGDDYVYIHPAFNFDFTSGCSYGSGCDFSGKGILSMACVQVYNLGSVAGNIKKISTTTTTSTSTEKFTGDLYIVTEEQVYVETILGSTSATDDSAIASAIDVDGQTISVDIPKDEFSLGSSSFSNISIDEDIEYGVCVLNKTLENINRSVATDLEFKLSIENFGRKNNSVCEDGRFCTPFFISIGDGNRVMLLKADIQAVKNAETGEIEVLSVSEDDITSDEFSNFDDIHATRNTSFPITDTLDISLDFREKETKIDFGRAVDLSDVKKNKIFDDSAKPFVIIDENGVFFKVISFLDGAGRIQSAIPDEVWGVTIERIPSGMPGLSAMGSYALENYLPIGNIILGYQCVKVTTEDDPVSSKKVWGYNDYGYVVDLISSPATFKMKRDPLLNVVSVKILKYEDTQVEDIRLFYTDLPRVSDVGPLLDTFGMEDNNDDGLYAEMMGAITSLAGGSGRFSFGMLDMLSSSVVNIHSLSYVVHNKLSVDDIYIGKNAISPSRLPFVVNKDDISNKSMGIPFNSDSKEGIFIGFDELCESPLSSDIGQWVFRTRIAEQSFVPTDVIVSEKEVRLLGVTVADADEEPSTSSDNIAPNFFWIDGDIAPDINLRVGSTYRFDQSDLTNVSGNKKIHSLHHPIALSTTEDGTHAGGKEYLRGVARSIVPVGQNGSYIDIEISDKTPSTLYYYCKNHSGMGGKLSISHSVLSEPGVASIVHNHENKLSLVPIRHTVSGKIETDGELSSVVRAYRQEDGSGCSPGVMCSDTYRYCGSGLLEDSGWKKIDESDSDLINTIIGGRETSRASWIKYGDFETSVSGGVYRIGKSTSENSNFLHDSKLGNFLYTRAPCYSGDVEIISSIKVTSIDEGMAANTGSFDGAISGKTNGIVPINFNDGVINIKLALATGDDGSPLVLIMDDEESSILDIVYYNWNNGSFNNFSILKNLSSETIDVKINESIVSRLNFDEFSKSDIDLCGFIKEPYVAIFLNDGSILNTDTYHAKNDPSIIDIDLIYFSGRFEDGVATLEEDDIFINTDSKVEFSFTTRVPSQLDGYGIFPPELLGLLDAYDAYDAYAAEMSYDVDEMYITSDLKRYVLDSGADVADGRISLFKDGKGFFNFRIFDDTGARSGETGFFNIATNIKHFKPGELHHVAASWKLNTIDNKDEMHLFVDGLEAPNIYRFGGAVPVSVNDKFSDVSKEVLHSFMVSHIDFHDEFTDGSTLAGTSRFYSNSAGFSNDMIGRSILITSSVIGESYVGKQYIINSVDGNAVTFVSGSTMEAVTFDASVSDIKFKFPPTSGVSSNILTDVKNNSFSIFRENCLEESEEFGGTLYSVDDGVISIISGSQVREPKFRVNIDTKIIEFVGRDLDCNYVSTVEYSDIDVHIETFGLNMQRYKNTIEISGSSYKSPYGLRHPPMERDSTGESTILLNGPEPIDLKDISITRILADRQLVTQRNITEAPMGFLVSFEANMPQKSLIDCPRISEDKTAWLTSQPSEFLHKQNLGRYLELSFDSDNVHFCEKFDGYTYEDGYSASTLKSEYACDGAQCWPAWAGQYCGGKIVPVDNPAFKDDVFLSESDTHMYIISDGIPHDHNILDQIDGDIPYDANNPLEAKQQFYRFSIPKLPVFADNTTNIEDVPVGPIGVAINGVPFHGALDEVGNRIDEVGTIDGIGGYLNARGEYFYYKDPKDLYDDIYGEHSPIVGYAFDGFAIHGKQSIGGVIPTDLDEFGGHYHEDIGYHYHVKKTDSGIISGYRGSVDMSNFDSYHRSIPPVYPYSEITSGIPSMITLFGETIDGSNYETLLINENGKFETTKLFKNIEKIEGSLYIADSDYELGVISLSELNPISISDNGGEYAEVYDFRGGEFLITAAGSSGAMPFELHAGRYSVDYPAYLKVALPHIGKKIYIGTDMNKENSLNATIDEFRIISEMSLDTRPTEDATSGTRSVTEDYNMTNIFSPDKQTLCLMHFDDPIGFQARNLRRKEFLDEANNYKFKLDLEDRKNLLDSINSEDEFVSKMLKMNFTEAEAIETFITCHKANNGPIKNVATFYPGRNDFPLASNSVNDQFGNCAKFDNNEPLLLSNSKSIFRRKKGTIEFWVSPLSDTRFDNNRGYYVDIYSATRKRVTSDSPSKLTLSSAASKIVGIRLLNKRSEYSGYYSNSEMDQIIFDEIERSDISGRLTGGSGTDKDFSIGHALSSNGKEIILADALPDKNTDVIVDYIPVDSSGDRVSIFKDTNGDIVFSITANGVDNMVRSSVEWSKNSWHRVMCTYRTNSSKDNMRIFVDGAEGGIITYGKDIIYGSGLIYGQVATRSGSNKSVEYNIPLNDEFRIISVGSDIFNDYSANCRLDNLRFSRKNRRVVKDSSDDYIDVNYSSNLNTVNPVSNDDATTLILNFENSMQDDDSFATVIDSSRGVFNFDIEVVDDFGRINKEETEDLMIELVNRLKPAHTNANVKFVNNTLLSSSSSISSTPSAKTSATTSANTGQASSSSGSSSSSSSTTSSSSGGYSY